MPFQPETLASFSWKAVASSTHAPHGVRLEEPWQTQTPTHHSLVWNLPRFSTPIRRKSKLHLKPFQSICYWYNLTKQFSCIFRRINRQELAKAFLKKKYNKKVTWVVKEYYITTWIKTNWNWYRFWKKDAHVPNNFLYNSREKQIAKQMVLG